MAMVSKRTLLKCARVAGAQVAAYSFEVCTEGGVTYSAEAPTPSI